MNRRADNLLLDGAVWAISPGFESNDLGYSPNADRAGGHLGMIWRKILYSFDRSGFRRHARSFAAGDLDTDLTGGCAW